MIAYFKYSNGEAFTLNGSDYSGFFNIVDGRAYTGRLSSLDSELLGNKGTFISKFFLSKLELDTTYQNISTPTPYYSNVFDILNKQELDKILGMIDNNNMLVFKSLVLRNPIIYNFEKNRSHFYGLSSTDADARNDDIPSGKTTYTHIDPFSNDLLWGFMDDISIGTFLVDTYENFKYICSTGFTNYTLSGNFIKNDPLTVVRSVDLPHPEQLHQIYYDEYRNRISYVYNDYILIYDASNYADCDKLLLIDRIDLLKTSTIDYIFNSVFQDFDNVPVTFNTRFVTTNLNNPQFIKFGYNLRTGLSNNILTLMNKYSSDVYQTIDLDIFGVGEVLSLDIRQEDDNILILHAKDSGYWITYFDPNNTSNFYTKPLLDVTYDQAIYHIKFSKIDSNMFYTSDKKEFHSRFLTFPSYANGKLENSDLLYLKDYIFDKTIERFNVINIKWDSNKMESNKFNNILSNEYVANNKMYSLLHNIGRLYAMQQPFSDSYLNAVPLNLIKYYDGIICSESSFGLYFNNSISNLIKDTLNLYNQAANTFEISSDAVLSRQLEEITFEIENLYLNGNETVNIISIQRILLLGTKIQQKLLSVSV